MGRRKRNSQGRNRAMENNEVNKEQPNSKSIPHPGHAERFHNATVQADKPKLGQEANTYTHDDRSDYQEMSEDNFKKDDAKMAETHQEDNQTFRDDMKGNQDSFTKESFNDLSCQDKYRSNIEISGRKNLSDISPDPERHALADSDNHGKEDASGDSYRDTEPEKTACIDAVMTARKWQTNDDVDDDDEYNGYYDYKRDSDYIAACKKYEYFWRNCDIYSQWHKSKFTVNNKEFNCAEQFMMYNKARLFEDYSIAKDILKSKNPRYIKELGRKVRNFNEELWAANCLYIVKQANVAKFSQNDYIKKQLFSTRPKILVEASPFDEIWGIGLANSDCEAWNQKTWRGKNLLGFIITEVRDELMYDAGLINAEEKKEYLTYLVHDQNKAAAKPWRTSDHGLENTDRFEPAVRHVRTETGDQCDVKHNSLLSNSARHDEKQVNRVVGSMDKNLEETCKILDSAVDGIHDRSKDKTLEETCTPLDSAVDEMHDRRTDKALEETCTSLYSAVDEINNRNTDKALEEKCTSLDSAVDEIHDRSTDKALEEKCTSLDTAVDEINNRNTDKALEEKCTSLDSAVDEIHDRSTDKALEEKCINLYSAGDEIHDTSKDKTLEEKCTSLDTAVDEINNRSKDKALEETCKSLDSAATHDRSTDKNLPALCKSSDSAVDEIHESLDSAYE